MAGKGNWRAQHNKKAAKMQAIRDNTSVAVLAATQEAAKKNRAILEITISAPDSGVEQAEHVAREFIMQQIDPRMPRSVAFWVRVNFFEYDRIIKPGKNKPDRNFVGAEFFFVKRFESGVKVHHVKDKEGFTIFARNMGRFQYGRIVQRGRNQ